MRDGWREEREGSKGRGRRGREVRGEGGGRRDEREGSKGRGRRGREVSGEGGK